MKAKKAIALFMASVMVFSLAACSSPGSKDKPATTAAPAATGTSSTTQGASKEKVVLTFYDWSDEQGYLDPAVAAYNAQSDVAEVKVVYFPATEYAEKILSVFASGEEFDVLGVNGVSPYGEYQQKGLLADLSTYVKDSGVDTSVYGDVFKQSNQNGIFGLPYRKSVWMLFINEALYKEAGVAVPSKQMTWEEYRELCKKLTDKDTYAGLFGMDNYVYMQQRGGSVMDQDTSVIRQSLELWNTLEADKTHVPFAEKLELGQNCGSMFTSEPANSVAMYMNGSWALASYKAKYESGDMPFQYKVLPMPVPEGVSDYTAPCGMNFFSVPASSKHPAQAYDFIKFMCTYDGANILAQNATLTAYSDEAIQQTFMKSLGYEDTDGTLAKILFSPNNAIEEIYNPNYKAVKQIMDEEMELYLIGEQNLDTTMSNFENRRQEYMGK